MTQRLRNYCFTWNNPPAYIFEEGASGMRNKLNATYLCFGEETGESGTFHLQGYVEFKEGKTINQLKKIFNGIHWEARKGSQEQAIKYCEKDGKFQKSGEIKNQGKRNDLIELKNQIIEGRKVEDIMIDEPISYHQYGRTLNKIEDVIMRRKWRTTMTKGIWLWGRTGSWKSGTAFTDYDPKTHFLVPTDNGWWDGYQQQDIVIFNDLRGDVPYNFLLQLVDRWPMHVRRRNREPMPFISKTVIITSSLPPEQIYNNRNEQDSIEQLLRRFTVTEMVRNTYTVTEVVEGGNTDPLDHTPIPSFSGIIRKK